MGGLGGGRQRLEQRRHRATSAPRRPADPSRLSRPGRGRPRAGARGRPTGRPSARAAHEGAQRRERVVGDLARPHQVPQRGEHRRVVVGLAGLLRGRDEVGPERRAALVEVGEQRGVERVGLEALAPAGRSRPAWSRNARRTRPSVDPIAPAPTHTTSPDGAQARRGRRARARAGARGGCRGRAPTPRSGAPWSWADARRPGRRGRGGAGRRRATGAGSGRACRRRPARPPCAARRATGAAAGGGRRRRTTRARRRRDGTRPARPGRRARAPRARTAPGRPPTP